jgi:hypothetical protein
MMAAGLLDRVDTKKPRAVLEVAVDISFADLLAIIRHGSAAAREEQAERWRAAEAQRIEADILASLPEVCSWVRDDLDEVAKRRQEAQRTYRRRFKKFQQCAAAIGFPKAPYAPSVTALYLMESTVGGAPISEIKADRS